MSFTVYILACSDASFHSGVCKDLDRRLTYHKRGGNNYTVSRQPFALVFEKSFADIRSAIDYHGQIQAKSIVEIKNIIAGKLELLIKEYTYDPANDQNESVKSVVLPATYLGNLAYYAVVYRHHEIVIDLNEIFQKQTYRSRCSILTANGIQNLSVPVIRPNGKASTMSEVQISYAENWQKDHLKAIESAYRRAPYYEFYAPDLFAIIEKKHKRLIDLNLDLMTFLIQAFDWNKTLRFSHENEQCSVANKILVTKQGVQQPTVKTYGQVLNESGEFAQNLSLLDLLFNCGKGAAEMYL